MSFVNECEFINIFYYSQKYVFVVLVSKKLFLI